MDIEEQDMAKPTRRRHDEGAGMLPVSPLSALSGQGLKRHLDTLISRSLRPLLDGPVPNQHLDYPPFPSTVRRWSVGATNPRIEFHRPVV